jgi:hypothetical protein
VKTHEGGANDPIHESETTWLFIKTIDNGVENFIQMYLQLYLIKPYVTKLTKLPVVDILQGIHSIYNLSDSLCKGKNVSIALGKLFLSLISLSYGAASRQASKPGISFGQTIKNLVLWLSFVCLSVARTTSIFSLVALETPIPGLATFFLIHLLLVSLIFKNMVISCGKNSSLQNARQLVIFIMSCFASHTVIICFQTKERGAETFWTQLKFKSLILCENISLLLLTLLVPNLYPPEDYYYTSQDYVFFSIGLWLFGVLLQVSIFKYVNIRIS